MARIVTRDVMTRLRVPSYSILSAGLNNFNLPMHSPSSCAYSHHRLSVFWHPLVLGADEAVEMFGAVAFAHSVDRDFGDELSDIMLKSTHAPLGAVTIGKLRQLSTSA